MYLICQFRLIPSTLDICFSKEATASFTSRTKIYKFASYLKHQPPNRGMEKFWHQIPPFLWLPGFYTRIAMLIPRCSLQPRVKVLHGESMAPKFQVRNKKSEDFFNSLQRSFPRPSSPHVSTGTNIPQLSAVSCRLWHQDAMDWRHEFPAQGS